MPTDWEWIVFGSLTWKMSSSSPLDGGLSPSRLMERSMLRVELAMSTKGAYLCLSSFVRQLRHYEYAGVILR
jgi:hypothetical protein